MKEVSECASDFSDDAITNFKRDIIAFVAEKIAWQAIANASIALVAEKEAENKRKCGGASGNSVTALKCCGSERMRCNRANSEQLGERHFGR